MAKKSVITKTSGGTVTVACKLPHGFQMKVYEFEDGEEPLMGGGVKKTKLAIQVGDTIVLRGNAAPYGEGPRASVVGGFALTPNVPADFFATWLEQNHDADVVKKKLIFAAPKSEVRDVAKEHRASRSGLERIDVSKDSKDPRKLKSLETAEDMNKKQFEFEEED